MFNILSYLPAKKKLTGNGWYSFNGVCCHNRGHKADRRSRGGIKIINDTEWTYHCFNCNFKAGFTLGKPLTINTRNLLRWIGLSTEDIQRIELEGLRARELGEIFNPRIISKKLTFTERKLPDAAVPLDINNDSHYKYLAFLINRGLDPTAYSYYVTPTESGRNSNRIIVPYYNKGIIVGSTSRYIDTLPKKYIKDAPSGYLFGIDFQQYQWQHVIVCEGEFDAISIRGCAVMTNQISNEHAQQLNALNKPVIVVPDRDSSGMKIIDRALELGYRISMPDWDDSVKDINDAVQRYGVAATLLSIHRAATRNRIYIELNRKKYEK
jgi:5S rRNA maturation endonuclease (ribonuclease M5)